MTNILIIANQLAYDFDGEVKAETIGVVGTTDDILCDISNSVAEYEQRQFNAIPVTKDQARDLIKKLEEFLEKDLVNPIV